MFVAQTFKNNPVPLGTACKQALKSLLIIHIINYSTQKVLDFMEIFFILLS